MWKSGPSRARPGQAEPSQPGLVRRLGLAPGQLLELASFRKTIDSFTRNAHFRVAPPKPIISSTRNCHFQNSIPIPAVDDPRPASPTAVSKIAVKNYVRASAAECACSHALKKSSSLLNVTNVARNPSDMILFASPCQPVRPEGYQHIARHGRQPPQSHRHSHSHRTGPT